MQITNTPQSQSFGINLKLKGELADRLEVTKLQKVINEADLRELSSQKVNMLKRRLAAKNGISPLPDQAIKSLATLRANLSIIEPLNQDVFLAVNKSKTNGIQPFMVSLEAPVEKTDGSVFKIQSNSMNKLKVNAEDPLAAIVSSPTFINTLSTFIPKLING